MDFAKRKYRQGYYVNLSSNKKEKLKIANAHSKELDKRIADLVPIAAKKESSSNNSQLSILNSQFISTPIKNNLQNVPVYNRSENNVVKNNSHERYESDDASSSLPDNNIFNLLFVLLCIIIVILILGLLGLYLLFLIHHFGFILGILAFIGSFLLLLIIKAIFRI